MTAIVIDKKKYVLVPEKEYRALQFKAALKTKRDAIMPIIESFARSIDARG